MSLGSTTLSPRAKRTGSRRQGGSAPRAAPGEHARSLWAKAQTASQSAQVLARTGVMPTAPSIVPTTQCSVRRVRLWQPFARAWPYPSGTALSTAALTSTSCRNSHSILPSAGRFSVAKEVSGSRPTTRRTKSMRPTAREIIGGMQTFLATVEPFLKKVKP